MSVCIFVHMSACASVPCLDPVDRMTMSKGKLLCTCTHMSRSTYVKIEMCKARLKGVSRCMHQHMSTHMPAHGSPHTPVCVYALCPCACPHVSTPTTDTRTPVVNQTQKSDQIVPDTCLCTTHMPAHIPAHMPAHTSAHMSALMPASPSSRRYSSF